MRNTANTAATAGNLPADRTARRLRAVQTALSVYVFLKQPIKAERFQQIIASVLVPENKQFAAFKFQPLQGVINDIVHPFAQPVAVHVRGGELAACFDPGQHPVHSVLMPKGYLTQKRRIRGS